MVLLSEARELDRIVVNTAAHIFITLDAGGVLGDYKARMVKRAKDER